MEPELNREASSSSPERPVQAAPVFAEGDSHLDSEQITALLRPVSPQKQHLNQQLGQQLDRKLADQRERQLEQQLSQVRNELAAMESLMAEVSQIFELKYQQRLQPILEENNSLRQQLDQLYRQLHQLQPQQDQAQPDHLQPAQLAQKQPSQLHQPAQLAQNQQPQLPQPNRPQRQRSQRQRPKLQATQSAATRLYKNITKTATIDILNINGVSPKTRNPSHSSQGIAITGGPQRMGLTRSRRLRVLAAALLHSLGWLGTNTPAAAPGPRP